MDRRPGGSHTLRHALGCWLARWHFVRYTREVPAGPTPPKQEVARALLLRGSVFVHLDPRSKGVRVPDWLRDQPQLVLQIGLDMLIPIPDLRVDDDGVYGTLSFRQRPFTCAVDWGAVFALVGEDGRGMVWPEDLPPEIAAEVEREAFVDDGARRPKLSVIEGEDASPTQGPVEAAEVADELEASDFEPAGDEPDAGERDPRLPPYLRVIK